MMKARLLLISFLSIQYYQCANLPDNSSKKVKNIVSSPLGCADLDFSDKSELNMTPSSSNCSGDNEESDSEELKNVILGIQGIAVQDQKPAKPVKVVETKTINKPSKPATTTQEIFNQMISENNKLLELIVSALTALNENDESQGKIPQINSDTEESLSKDFEEVISGIEGIKIASVPDQQKPETNTTKPAANILKTPQELFDEIISDNKKILKSIVSSLKAIKEENQKNGSPAKNVQATEAKTAKQTEAKHVNPTEAKHVQATPIPSIPRINPNAGELYNGNLLDYNTIESIASLSFTSRFNLSLDLTILLKSISDFESTVKISDIPPSLHLFAVSKCLRKINGRRPHLSIEEQTSEDSLLNAINQFQSANLSDYLMIIEYLLRANTEVSLKVANRLIEFKIKSSEIPQKQIILMFQYCCLSGYSLLMKNLILQFNNIILSLSDIQICISSLMQNGSVSTDDIVLITKLLCRGDDESVDNLIKEYGVILDDTFNRNRSGSFVELLKSN